MNTYLVTRYGNTEKIEAAHYEIDEGRLAFFDKPDDDPQNLADLGGRPFLVYNVEEWEIVEEVEESSD